MQNEQYHVDSHQLHVFKLLVRLKRERKAIGVIVFCTSDDFRYVVPGDINDMMYIGVNVRQENMLR